MKINYYKCVCGKEYDNSNIYNFHRGRCFAYMESIGRLKKLENACKEGGRKSSITRKNNNTIKRDLKKLKWVSEQHTCEKCGKIMTEKFGSGRFCCRACSNSREHSKEERLKISLKMKMSNIQPNAQSSSKKRHEKAVKRYNNNPKYCYICGKKLTYEQRNRHVCSKECLHKQMHDRALKNVSKQHNNKIQYKWGTYKEIACDSSWELAYVVYCLEHNIKIERNTEGFDYINSKGELHKYYPDFIVDDCIYVEIKNYLTTDVLLKKEQFPKNLEYKLLLKKDIEHILTYVKNKYGKDFANVLYDKRC